jgi:hypothetical protein
VTAQDHSDGWLTVPELLDVAIYGEFTPFRADGSFVAFKKRRWREFLAFAASHAASPLVEVMIGRGHWTESTTIIARTQRELMIYGPCFRLFPIPTHELEIRVGPMMRKGDILAATLVVAKDGRLSGFEVTGLPVEPLFQLIEATMPEGTFLTHPLWPREEAPTTGEMQDDPTPDIDEQPVSIEDESHHRRIRTLPDRGYITSFEDAERNAAERMIAMGFLDARVTVGGADGGIDVSAHNALAQVKWRGGVSGRPDLQRLFGARGAALDKQLLFFSAAGYSTNALDYADSTGIALFVYEPDGELVASNSAAEALLAHTDGPYDDNPRDRRDPPMGERMQFLQWLRDPQTSDQDESGHHPHS